MNNFSAESRIIAAFTFVVVLMLGGWQSVAGLVTEVFRGGIAPELPQAAFAAIIYITVGAVTTGALLVARAAVAATETVWTRHLGQATQLLAVLVLVAAAIGLLAGVINGQSIWGLPRHF